MTLSLQCEKLRLIIYICCINVERINRLTKVNYADDKAIDPIPRIRPLLVQLRIPDRMLGLKPIKGISTHQLSVNSNMIKNKYMKKLFIGIDFSKKKFDVSFFESEKMETIVHNEFENSKSGFIEMISWITLKTEIAKDKWLFCGEHTGLYSIALTEYLLKKKLFIWLENPLQIKMSMGIRREKSDKVDSRDIALYAYRFQDRARLSEIREKDLSSLALLLSYRERLVKNKRSILVAAKEIRSVLNRDKTARYIYEQTKKDVERLNKEIKDIEKKMLEIIKENAALKSNYDRVASIKGIALINTVALLVHTGNFTRFRTARQLACYSGVVPFEKTSGTSLKQGKHISPMANIQIKTLLTQAARCAVIHDKELKAYYHRKIKEGKLDRIVINNVRNKLLHRVFAVVTKKQMYEEDYINKLKNTNQVFIY